MQTGYAMLLSLLYIFKDHYVSLFFIAVAAVVLPRVVLKNTTEGGGGAAGGGAKLLFDVIGAVAAVGAIVGFVYTPKEFYIVAVQDDLLLNQTLEVNVRVRQKDATDSPLQTYRCHYSFNPSLPADAIDQDTGCKLTITDLPTLFTSGQKSPMPVQVSADRLGWPWEGPNPIQLNLYNVSKPQIRIGGTKFQLGANIPIKVEFADHAPQGFTCLWSPASRFRPANVCETHFVVPIEGSALSSKSISASANVSFDGKKFASDSISIEVEAPPPHLFQIVLDVSGRMGIPLAVGNRESFFEASRDALIAEIKLFNEQGGWLSIIGFGDPVAPPNAKICKDKVAAIYEFGAVDSSGAETTLAKLSVGGSDAPVASAIDRAADEYKNNRPIYADSSEEKTFVFALITDGTTQCDVANLPAAVRQLAAAFDQRGLRQHLYSRGSLSFVVSKDSREARLTYNDERYRENRTILLLVKNDLELRQIVKAIGGLFSKEPTTRKDSCQRLSAPLNGLADQLHKVQLQTSRPCS